MSQITVTRQREQPIYTRTHTGMFGCRVCWSSSICLVNCSSFCYKVASLDCICLTSPVTPSEPVPKSVSLISVSQLQRKCRPLEGKEKGKEAEGRHQGVRDGGRRNNCGRHLSLRFSILLSSIFVDLLFQSCPDPLVSFFPSLSMLTHANPSIILIV